MIAQWRIVVTYCNTVKTKKVIVLGKTDGEEYGIINELKEKNTLPLSSVILGIWEKSKYHLWGLQVKKVSSGKIHVSFRVKW